MVQKNEFREKIEKKIQFSVVIKLFINWTLFCRQSNRVLYFGTIESSMAWAAFYFLTYSMIKMNDAWKIYG